MGFSKILATLSVAALAVLAPAAVEAQSKPLPWDGRGQDVSVATLEDKFKLHIFKQRQSGTGNPADYVTVQPKGRSPAFNGDTGVINIAVDDKAIFGGQTNFRRSELVQDVAGGATTFFRASIMANAELKNKHVWQVFFPESHQWEVFVDASASPMKIQFRTEARVQWETEFTTKTWYNFGIAVASSGMTLYTSKGNAALAKTFSDNKAGQSPNSYELHFGLLTLSNDGSAPKMVAGQDILSFNGVTVDSKVSTDGGSGGSAAAPDADADDAADDETEAPAATTAPTSAPATPATSKPATPASPATTKPAAATPATTKPAAATPATTKPAAATPTVAPATSAPKPAATTAPKPAATSSKCKAKRRN